MLLLRLLHIVTGALWVGSAFLFAGFIGPSAAEVAPTAGPLLHAAVKKRKVAKVITGLGVISVLAGWTMWIRNMNLYDSIGDWVSTDFGLVLTVGGVLATVAFFLGAIGVGHNVERLVDLGDEVAASGTPPSPEQHSQMERLGGQIETAGKVELALLLLAVAAMATARYW
jgi:hypothetical protein